MSFGILALEGIDRWAFWDILTCLSSSLKTFSPTNFPTSLCWSISPLIKGFDKMEAAKGRKICWRPIFFQQIPYYQKCVKMPFRCGLCCYFPSSCIKLIFHFTVTTSEKCIWRPFTNVFAGIVRVLSFESRLLAKLLLKWRIISKVMSAH